MRRRPPLLPLALALSLGPAPGQAKVPAITAGPDLFVTAPVIPAPIAEVTVFSDRAEVIRRGPAEGPPGVRAVRLPDLPGATLLDSLRVGAEGAEVLRVEAAPVDQPRAAIGQAAELVEQLEALSRTLARHDARRAVILAETQLLDALSPRPPGAEEHRKRGPLAVDPTAWRAVRAFIQTRRTARVETLRGMDQTREGVVEAAAKLQAELQRFNQAAFSHRRTVQVVALIEARSRNPKIEVAYFVPGASWRPAYTTELSDEGRKLTVRTTGRVQQATGEDWEDVSLSLSTAIPQQSIEAPELLTWTLGEAKDFTPKPQAEAPRPPQRLGGPAPRQTPAERADAEARRGLRQRIHWALQVGHGAAGPRYAGNAEGNYGEDSALGDLYVGSVGGSGGGRGAGSFGAAAPSVSRAPAPPPQPKRAAAPGAPSMAAPMEALVDEPSERAAAEKAADDRSIAVMGNGGGPRPVPVDLFEPEPPAGPRFSDPSLPAVVAGGLDYVYRSTTRVSVPSSPEQHQVPLSAETWPVTPIYAAAPALEPTAFLQATVKHQGDKPLLGGPVDIFVGADFVGSGQIQTTEPGGEVTLPLGADEDLKLVRRVVPKTQTEGVFSKEDVTAYTTEIDVVNHKRRRIRLRLVEQFPLSDVEDLKIERGAVSPKPVEGPDEAGIMAFQLDLAPGEKQTVRFQYRLRRPANWRMYQR